MKPGMVLRKYQVPFIQNVFLKVLVPTIKTPSLSICLLAQKTLITMLPITDPPPS